MQGYSLCPRFRTHVVPHVPCVFKMHHVEEAIREAVECNNGGAAGWRLVAAFDRRVVVKGPFADIVGRAWREHGKERDEVCVFADAPVRGRDRRWRFVIPGHESLIDWWIRSPDRTVVVSVIDGGASGKGTIAGLNVRIKSGVVAMKLWNVETRVSLPKTLARLLFGPDIESREEFVVVACEAGIHFPVPVVVKMGMKDGKPL